VVLNRAFDARAGVAAGMKLEGTTDFPHSPDEVWATLHDVDVLVKTIPGCTGMSPQGVNAYRVALSLGVASIKGEYEGSIEVDDVEYPSHYRLRAAGSGKPGFVNMNVECRLDPVAAGTLMRWSCDTEVGGLIAGIGGRVLSGVSKFMANQFFKALKAEMACREHGNGEVVQR
jgi:carbon monoxide dehydrogenase subunit G